MCCRAASQTPQDLLDAGLYKPLALALYPGVFPSLRKFESELVSSVVGLVHGHECGAVGLLSSGGTESVLLAALSYREMARKRGIAARSKWGRPSLGRARHAPPLASPEAPAAPQQPQVAPRQLGCPRSLGEPAEEGA